MFSDKNDRYKVKTAKITTSDLTGMYNTAWVGKKKSLNSSHFIMLRTSLSGPAGELWSIMVKMIGHVSVKLKGRVISV